MWFFFFGGSSFAQVKSWRKVGLYVAPVAKSDTNWCEGGRAWWAAFLEGSTRTGFAVPFPPGGGGSAVAWALTMAGVCGTGQLSPTLPAAHSDDGYCCGQSQTQDDRLQAQD